MSSLRLALAGVAGSSSCDSLLYFGNMRGWLEPNLPERLVGRTCCNDWPTSDLIDGMMLVTAKGHREMILRFSQK